MTSPLSDDGKLALYNLAGTVDGIVDVVGYYGVLPVTPTTPTTLAPFAFEASITPPAINATYSLAGFDQTNNTDVRAAGWLAPRACTLSGTVTMIGGVQHANTNNGFGLVFARWDAANVTLIANGPPLLVSPSTASGTPATIPSLAVGAGELVTFRQLTNVGTSVDAKHHALPVRPLHLSVGCTSARAGTSCGRHARHR